VLVRRRLLALSNLLSTVLGASRGVLTRVLRLIGRFNRLSYKSKLV